jgi:hypothetical protein
MGRALVALHTLGVWRDSLDVEHVRLDDVVKAAK